MFIRRIVPLAVVLAAATCTVAVTAVSATAATSPKGVRTSSCTLAHLGNNPYNPEKSNSKPTLAWTIKGSNEGSGVDLATYGNHGTQCWKTLGNFPAHPGTFEFQANTTTGLCLSVQGASRAVNANIALYRCVSAARELWQPFFDGNFPPQQPVAMFKNVNSGLCIEVIGGPTAGHRLVQAKCSNFGSWQTWRETLP